LVVDLSDREISAEIIEACLLVDRDAFRALYDAYKDRVYSISLYFFHGDPAMASDVSQQVFLKLITSIGQFRGDAGFSTWGGYPADYSQARQRSGEGRRWTRWTMRP